MKQTSKRLWATAALLLIILPGCRTLGPIPYPVKGGIRFEFFRQDSKKEKIELIGSWNGWHKGTHEMNRIGNYHWIEIDIPPGRYQFIFISKDGRFFLPDNVKQRIPDDFGNQNGFLVVGGTDLEK